MKILREAKRIPGIEIERNRVKGKVSLTQKAYLQKVLQKLDIGSVTKSVSSPLPPISRFRLICLRILLMSVSIYLMFHMSMSSVMYAMLCMRPDLSHVVSMISRYMHDSDKGHWKVVRWILRYIKSTIDVGLVFEKDDHGKQECTCYVNSDYAGDLNRRLLITRYVFILSQALVN